MRRQPLVYPPKPREIQVSALVGVWWGVDVESLVRVQLHVALILGDTVQRWFSLWR